MIIGPGCWPVGAWLRGRRSGLGGFRSGPGSDLAAGLEAQLGQDVLDMVLGGSFGDVQNLGDLAVGEPPGDQPRDLVAPRCATPSTEPKLSTDNGSR